MKNREEDKHKQKQTHSENINLDREGAASIPVIEEKINIEKEVVETGKVYLSKKVHEEEQELRLPEAKEEVDVERVAVNQYVDEAPPAVRHEGDTMIIPVLREEIVVEKRLLLVEEVRVTKRRQESEKNEKIKLRKEEVDVRREKKTPQSKRDKV